MPLMAINGGLHNGEEMGRVRGETAGRLWLGGSRRALSGRGSARSGHDAGARPRRRRRVQGRKKGARVGPACKREGVVWRLGWLLGRLGQNS
jgi:hypothetical protein